MGISLGNGEAGILELNNGIRIIASQKCLLEIFGDDAKKTNLLSMAERIENARKGVGFNDAIPIVLEDTPEDGYSCSAGVYPLEETLPIISSTLNIQVTDQNVDGIWPNRKDLQKLAPCIFVSSGCLAEQSRFYNWDEFEAVAAHEIGHILRHDTNGLRDHTWQLSSWLHELALLRDFVVHKPAKDSSAVTQGQGGKGAFLSMIDKTFQDIGEKVEDVLSYAKAENGGHYAETLIDHLTDDEKTGALLKSVRNLPSIPDDAPVPLNQYDEKSAYTLSPPAILDVLEKAHTLAFLASAAVEILADDIATRHSPAASQDLFNSFHHKFGLDGVVDGPEHFSAVNRFTRSVILDETRRKMAKESGKIDETATTHATNQAMRDVHDATQAIKEALLHTPAAEYTEEKTTMTNARKAWIKRNLASTVDTVEAAGGRQWLYKVEKAGIEIATSRRRHTDHIKAEQAEKAKSPQGNAR